jgi:hypothetical protein
MFSQQEFHEGILKLSVQTKIRREKIYWEKRKARTFPPASGMRTGNCMPLT